VSSSQGNDSPERELYFEVEDTGIGIATEDKAHIFDPFVQAGNIRTRGVRDWGLSISRRFVELLGVTDSSGERTRTGFPGCSRSPFRRT
jgi:signal transduction histidine kinase